MDEKNGKSASTHGAEDAATLGGGAFFAAFGVAAVAVGGRKAASANSDTRAKGRGRAVRRGTGIGERATR
ncbi:MAG: hypothetical protein RL479_1820 [Verrucomicrobiota bacterium]